jgi:hypothetical protein
LKNFFSESLRFSIDKDMGASSPDSIGSTLDENTEVVFLCLSLRDSSVHVTDASVEFNLRREINLVGFVVSSSILENRVFVSVGLDTFTEVIFVFILFL